MKMQFHWVTLSGIAALALTGFTAPSLAQTSAPDSASPAEQGTNYGSGMMNGYGSGYDTGMMGGSGGEFGPGMMGGYGLGHAWSGNSKTAFADRLEALKLELKITSDQTPAWKTYTDAASASDQSFFTAMKATSESDTKTAITQDDRFALMIKMISLKKQNFHDQKAAAEVLAAKLTPYQSGQAHEILPGLANGDGFGEHHGMGSAMMKFDQ